MAKNKRRKNVKHKDNERFLFNNIRNKMFDKIILDFKSAFYNKTIESMEYFSEENMETLKDIYSENKFSLNDTIFLYQETCEMFVGTMFEEIDRVVDEELIEVGRKFLSSAFVDTKLSDLEPIPSNKIDSSLKKLQESIRDALKETISNKYNNIYEDTISVLFNEIVKRGTFSNNDIDDELICEECLNTLINYCNSNDYKLKYTLVSINDELDNQEIEDSSNYSHIENWKELSSLAEHKGYKLIRHNGDHGIFKNSMGNMVVIPQGRSIGKGLSIKIQKRLNEIDIL